MFQQDNPEKYTMIAYHMSWPGIDPYHNFNAGEANVRRSYYSVIWVPWFASNGNNSMNTQTSTVQDWKDHILSTSTSSAPIELSISGSYDAENLMATAMVTIQPETGTNGDYTLHLVLVEDHLYHPGSTTPDDMHQAVMRNMIPTAEGTRITLTEGVETVEQFIIPTHASFVAENCRLVAFVQADDKTVLNAATEDLTAMPSPPLPLLSVVDTEISIIGDDGDMKLNPGEQAIYTPTILNECNWTGASDVIGTLTSSDPNITIVEGEASFGDVEACNERTNSSGTFIFEVSENSPPVTDLHLTLTLRTGDGGTIAYIPYEREIELTEHIDRFRYNFPVPVEESLTSGNAVVDLDGDGLKEVIICGLDSAVHVFTNDGVELSGFPFKAGHTILGSPAVADIDNNGDLEIVIASNDKHVYVIQHDGSGASIGEALNSMIATPALDDLDNDGDLEIVIGSFGSDLLVLHHDGTAYSGFPLMVSGEIIYRGAAIADIDGDGNKDIVFGTSKGKIYAVDRTGANLSGFPVDSIAGSQHSRVRAPPIVTDIDGNGTLEIIVGQDKGVLSAVSNLGEVLWTHQIETGRIWTSAAVSDFDNNGTMETVYNTQAGHITVLDHLGADLTGWPQEVGDGFSSSPVITDLTGDGVPEIIVGTKSGELYAFYLDGTVVEDYPVALSSQAQGTATVADIDNNGWLEIVIGTDKDLTIVDSKIRSSIGYKWSTARGNLQRTGFYNPLLTSNDSPIELPSSLVLIQNYPNPFNAATTLQFGIPDNNPVRLRIFDALGQEVTQLVNSNLAGGSYSISWNGMNNYGELVETGIYFAKLDVGVESKVIKMILMK